MYLGTAIPCLSMLILAVCTFYLLRSWTGREPFSQCSPECCLPPHSAQLSCSTGCVCLNKKDSYLLGTRGGNGSGNEY